MVTPMVSHPILYPNMQPVRRKRIDPDVGLGDQFAEWLISRIPLTTLVLLGLVVIASAITFDRPWILIAGAVAGDVVLSFSRRTRRPRAAESARFVSRAPV
jgi:hypothetical protein